MRTDLDHLPAGKQRELERVLQILFEEFEEARSLATQEWKKRGRILKIILYGSYARGNWVDEPHTAKGYLSDFDLLIIVNDKRFLDRVQFWAKAEERLNRELSITRTLKTPVNFIVHTLNQVNWGLEQGRFFFMDIARDGIAIYQSDNKELALPRPKSPAEALEFAKEYYEEWFPTAMQRFELASLARSRGFLKPAAFDLHQTAEFLYHCVLLVCTFYSPHTHNLAFLRTQAERLDARLVGVWPIDTRKERAIFEKLKDAYVKARYSKHYRIVDDELGWLGERIDKLAQVVHAVCADRIRSLERTTALQLHVTD